MNTRRTAPRPHSKPEDTIGYRIRHLAALLGQHGRLSLKESLGLTQAEWRILVSLGVRGALNPHVVAQEAGLNRSHVTQAVRGLRRRRLVSQQADEDDGRRILLSLTKSGVALLDRGIDAYAPRRTLLAGVLTSAEQVVFDRAIAKLTQAAERMLAEKTGLPG